MRRSLHPESEEVLLWVHGMQGCDSMCVDTRVFATVARKKKARAPETSMAAYRLGCHDDRGMGKAPLESPLKRRAVPAQSTEHSRRDKAVVKYLRVQNSSTGRLH